MIRLGMLAVAAGLCCSAASANVIIGLGAASNYTVFGLEAGSSGTAINASAVTINGDVGISNLSSMHIFAPSHVNGNVIKDPGASLNQDSAGAISGSVITQSLNQAVNDAFFSSNQNRLLAANQTVTGNVTSAQTFNSAGAETVIHIAGGINLNNSNITLHGGVSDIFLVNVDGDLSLTGTASLVLSGGLTANHVIYNFTGGTAANHGAFNTHVGDVVYGTMLAPFYDMNLDGTWNGALIGGPLTIGLLSNASVNGMTFTVVPLPPAAWAGLSTLVGAMAVRTIRRRRDR